MESSGLDFSGCQGRTEEMLKSYCASTGKYYEVFIPAKPMVGQNNSPVINIYQKT